jgi:hypothetical protein
VQRGDLVRGGFRRQSAYASGLLENNTTDACTGWLEDSVNGGAWTSGHAS